MSLITSNGERMNRRTFLQKSALVAGALNLAPAGVLGRNGQPGASGHLVHPRSISTGGREKAISYQYYRQLPQIIWDLLQ